MNEDTKYSIIFIGLGVIGIWLGVTGAKPTYGGGWVRKYGSIVAGVVSLLYGLFLLLK